MSKHKITLIYTFSKDIIVEANSKSEAIKLAKSKPERLNDMSKNVEAIYLKEIIDDFTDEGSVAKIKKKQLVFGNLLYLSWYSQ